MSAFGISWARERFKAAWRQGIRLRLVSTHAALILAGCVVPLSPAIPGDDAGSDGSSSGLTGPPPPSGHWTNVTANLANMDSECGSLSGLFAKPDEDLLIAGIALHGLWGSRDGGLSWQQLPGSTMITNRVTWITFDPQSSKRFWESGIYHTNGVYETTDDGTTFTPLGNITHNDSIAVDFTDPQRRTMLAGGHEQERTLNRSTDSGSTWTNVGGGLPAGTFCTEPVIIDAKTYLAGCASYPGAPSGIYRSTDGGTTWTQVTKSGGSARPLVASNGWIYWSTLNDAGITRSEDGGKTWTGLLGSGVVRTSFPIELPDGRIAILGQKYVVASSDHGATWVAVTPLLPYDDAINVVYSSQRRSFYVFHYTCSFDGGPVLVPTDGVMRYEVAADAG